MWEEESAVYFVYILDTKFLLPEEEKEKLIYGKFIFYSFFDLYLSVVTEIINRQAPSQTETSVG